MAARRTEMAWQETATDAQNNWLAPANDDLAAVVIPVGSDLCVMRVTVQVAAALDGNATQNSN